MSFSCYYDQESDFWIITYNGTILESFDTEEECLGYLYLDLHQS